MSGQPEPPTGPATTNLPWTLHELAVATAEVDVAVSIHLGITAGDYLALKHLMATPTPIGPVELSRLLGITSGSATALVDRLEQAGHLTRHPHPTDRRRRTLTVSATTRARVLLNLRPLFDAVNDVAGSLDPVHRDVCRRFLAAVIDAHRTHLAPRQPAERGRLR